MPKDVGERRGVRGGLTTGSEKKVQREEPEGSGREGTTRQERVRNGTRRPFVACSRWPRYMSSTCRDVESTDSGVVTGHRGDGGRYEVSGGRSCWKGSEDGGWHAVHHTHGRL